MRAWRIVVGVGGLAVCGGAGRAEERLTSAESAVGAAAIERFVEQLRTANEQMEELNARLQGRVERPVNAVESAPNVVMDQPRLSPSAAALVQTLETELGGVTATVTVVGPFVGVAGAADAEGTGGGVPVGVLARTLRAHAEDFDLMVELASVDGEAEAEAERLDAQRVALVAEGAPEGGLVLVRRSGGGGPGGFGWTFVPRREASPAGEPVELADRVGLERGFDRPVVAGTGSSVASERSAVITPMPLPEPAVVVIDLPRARQTSPSAAATVTGVISR